MPLGSRARTGVRRIVVHLVNSASNLVGDDILGRRLRRSLLAAAGAQLAPAASFHGGTYFSRPRNLRAGERCFVNRNCYLDLDGVIELGEDVVVGHGSTLITSHHTLGPTSRRAGPVVPRAVTVERGAWIGANCVIMPGVTVGAGAVVAAGAVVLSDVPADVIVAGVPARVVRKLDDDHPRAPDPS